MIYIILLNHQICPRHKVTPCYILFEATPEVWNWSVFAHLHHLSALNQFHQGVKSKLLTSVVIGSWITVKSYHIQLSMPWVPRRLGGRPDPDQIVNFMIAYDPFHYNIQ